MSNDNDWDSYGFATRSVRAGQVRTEEGENAEPIFTTSSFVFEDAAQAAARFAQEEEGNVYSRFTNPTVRTFEQRLASLEGGEACVATASGMGAILATCLGLLQAGDHVVSSRSIFGATRLLFKNIMAKFGVTFEFVSPTDMDEWKRAMTQQTKMLFLETPANPLTEIIDIAALASITDKHEAILVVDNCFCTPALQLPFALGADLVIHSATKYLDGQGRCVGGAIIGDEERVGEKIFSVMRSAGPTMSPFNAWVFLKGLETLDLRMRAISRSADLLARWLTQQPKVQRVYYPGLESHPQYELARTQQKAAGGIVSFEVAGDKTAAWRLIDATKFLSITANLGDTKTTITHPASTTHSRWSPEERIEAGISDSLVRVAVGLEEIEDIQSDLRFDLID